MPREFSRTDRIAESIQHEIAQILQYKIADPHLKNISVLKAEITKDLSIAKIYVSCLGSAEEIKDKLRRLNKAAAFCRYLLANSMELRVTPHLRFFYDASVEKSSQLIALLESIDKPKHDTN